MNRWELEESRKKKALEAVKAQIDADAKKTVAPAAKVVKETVTPKTSPAKSNSSTAKKSGGFSGKRSGTSGGRSRPHTSIGDLRQQEYEQTRQRDMQSMLQNSAAWHGAAPAEQEKLFQKNNVIRGKYGLDYEPSSGITYRNSAAGRENMLNPAYSLLPDSAKIGTPYEQKPKTHDQLAALTEQYQKEHPYLLALESNDRKGDAFLYFLTHPQKMVDRVKGGNQAKNATPEEQAEMLAVYEQYKALVKAKNDLDSSGGVGYAFQNAALNAANVLENAGRALSGYTNKAVGFGASRRQ